MGIEGSNVFAHMHLAVGNYYNSASGNYITAGTLIFPPSEINVGYCQPESMHYNYAQSLQTRCLAFSGKRDLPSSIAGHLQVHPPYEHQTAIATTVSSNGQFYPLE